MIGINSADGVPNETKEQSCDFDLSASGHEQVSGGGVAHPSKIAKTKRFRLQATRISSEIFCSLENEEHQCAASFDS